MPTDLLDKLRQLGVTKGSAHLQPPAPRRARVADSSFDGQKIASSAGEAFVVQECYALDHSHGDTALRAFLEQPAPVAAQLACEPALAYTDPSRCVFLDTETTGLSGGAGTLVFLVGLGSFDRDTFCIRQFFLHDPDKEAAMLAALSERAGDYAAIVTFNGRGFDLPLLQARYTLARMSAAWLALPHLDLLSPARRVWRDRLPSCALLSLETCVLGVRRAQDDVPSYRIPQIYRDYLAGDAREMPGVLYHNRQDILSMVTLATRLCQMFADPLADGVLDVADLVSLGKWYDDLGMNSEAERAFRAALEREPRPMSRATALARLGWLLKRQDRREQAVVAWEQLAQADAGSVMAHVELAKHFEWRAGDLERALEWTHVAQKIAATWPPGAAQDQTLAELAHRAQRLERKQRTERKP